MFITNERTKKKTVLRGPFVCLVCGKVFHKYIDAIRAKTVKVCSKECFPQYFKNTYPAKGEMRPCIKCKKEFFVQFCQDDRRGKKRQYCSKDCMVTYGRQRWKSTDGYWIISTSEYKIGIKEHRHVMEQSIKRKLTFKDIVHHKNGDKLDNRIENLELTNRADHNAMHNVKHGRYVKTRLGRELAEKLFL